MKDLPVRPTEIQAPIEPLSSAGDRRRRRILMPLALGFALGGIAIATLWPKHDWRRSLLPVAPVGTIAPLAMEGGNPHVRALLRTISASESNDASPYTLLYGGDHFKDLSQHPDQCLPIVSGPNKGRCTTAAGRYQFLTTTWEEKAEIYHPNPDGMLFWKHYSYEAFYQDQVVYNWLSDSAAWGADIPQLLEAGNIDEVFRILSGTWTSLGYGIEDNWFTPSLPRLYAKLLEDELAMTDSASNAFGNAIEP
ncbi:MAG: glycoside hydrolase family protein [Cyanobacteria bacterium P01_F01_bin.42]